MVSTDHFRRELQAQLARASACGLADSIISAGMLHRMSGGYPGSQHGIQRCREAMRAEIQPGDVLLAQDGVPDLTVRYQLPRTLTGCVTGQDFSWPLHRGSRHNRQ